jgi:hypothetical protein
MRLGLTWGVTTLLSFAGASWADVPHSAPARSTEANALLKQMSDYLGGLSTFRVETRATDERVTTEGQRIQFPFSSRVEVRRPNGLRVDRSSPTADAEFRYDGTQFAVYNAKDQLFAKVPAPSTLDQAIDLARDKYGIDAPASDLLLSHPYEGLMEGVISSNDLGLETVDGVSCHHLAFRNREVDWQIWIEDGPRPLPHRYVIVSKLEKAQPEFEVRLSRWELNPEISDDAFAFAPPSGAKQIPLIEQGARHGRTPKGDVR